MNLPLPRLSPVVLALATLLVMPVRAQDRVASDTARVQLYQQGGPLAPANPVDGLLCPGDVPIGNTAVDFNGEVTTTSQIGIAYEVQIRYSSGTAGGVGHTGMETNTGAWTVSPGTNETLLQLTVTVTAAQALQWAVSLVAQTLGTASYTFQTFLAGTIRNDETCTFEIVEAVESDSADLALDLTIPGALSIGEDTVAVAVGAEYDFLFEVVNTDTTFDATGVVLGGGVDPSVMALGAVTQQPAGAACSVDQAQGFFVCSDLTVAPGDTNGVVVTGTGLVEGESRVEASISSPTPDPNPDNNVVSILAQFFPGDGRIEGTSFFDANQDGVFDALDEQGLEGWVLFVDANANRQFDADTDPYTTSDADGHYSLDSLLEVTTTVGGVLPEDRLWTVPEDGFQTVDLGDDPQAEDVNFGSRPRAGAILGSKWEDRDADGQIDQDELHLEGWTIYVDLNNNDMLDDGEPSAMTDELGRYLIGDLDPGTYVVREVQQAGFAQTFPQNPDHHTVTLTEGKFVGGIRFGNRAVSSIHGVAYVDLNANGQRDEGEPGLDGREILLLDLETGAEVAETMTMPMVVDGDTLHGVYWFENVSPGVYHVFGNVPFGFAPTEPAETQGPFGPINAHTVILSAGARKDSLNFGNARAANVDIEKEGPTIVADGSLITYTLTVGNTSLNDAPNTIVRDTLDARLEWVSATTTQGSCSFSEIDRVVTCNLDTLPPGATVEIKIIARLLRLEDDRRFTNAATVESSLLDPMPQDNRSQIRTLTTERNLDIAKEASSQEVKVGEQITYTLLARTLRVDSDQVVITDTLPEEVEFASVSTSRQDLLCRYDASSHVVTCDPSLLTSLPDTIRITVVAVRSGAFPNIATVAERESILGYTEMHADTAAVTITEDEATPTDPEADVPDAFRLYDNYPNPFNPQTTIRFDMPQRARVRLTVFDVLGRVVTTLVDEPLAPGSHRAVFEAGTLPSGVYFYRLEAGAFSETRPMILLK